ncbi:MAG: hypothetical protein V1736_04450 [Pseudomonadota bacterium]
MSTQPTSNAAGRDGSALRMLKLFRDRPFIESIGKTQREHERKTALGGADAAISQVIPSLGGGSG